MHRSTKITSILTATMGMISSLCITLSAGSAPFLTLTAHAKENPSSALLAEDGYDNEYYDDEEDYDEWVDIDDLETVTINEEFVEQHFSGSAFQALRWALSSTSGAKKIIVDKNSYPEIHDPGHRRLMIYSNKELDLGGATLRRSGSENLLVTGNPDVEAKGYAYKNIKIYNGTIDGGTDDAGLCRFARVDGLTLKNLNFINFGKHAAEFAAVKNVEINNCKFQKPNYKVKSVKSGYEALSMDMTSYDEDFRNYGPADYLTCKNFKVKNCTFKGLYRGLGSHHYKNKIYYEKIEVSGCTFTNIEDTAIECAGWVKSTIKNNKLNKVGFGIDCRQPMTSIKNSKTYSTYNCKNVIEGNNIVMKMSGNKLDHVGIRVGGFVLDKKTNGVKAGKYYVNGYKVRNNKISGKCTYCLAVEFTRKTTLSGNKLNADCKKEINYWFAE